MITHMRQAIFIACIISILITFIGCKFKPKSLFIKKTEREKYEQDLHKRTDSVAVAWLSASSNAIGSPYQVELPYVENGYFTGNASDANGYRFTLKPGQKAKIIFLNTDSGSKSIFLELFNTPTIDATGGLLKAADTITTAIDFISVEGGNFIARLQPKLLENGNYILKIYAEPMLGFPIAAGVKSNIGSVWGDNRDEGIRKHEGIDIFAKKGSDVVAVADGSVSSISNSGLGGKVIWLSPQHQAFSVYYAHLDTQLVTPGTHVRKGQRIGTVGNTGNAKFTPSHLHFGIYTHRGAVDPLSFVQEQNQVNEPVKKPLNQRYKLATGTKLYANPSISIPTTVDRVMIVKTVSFTGKFYRVLFPNGKKWFVPAAILTNKMLLPN